MSCHVAVIRVHNPHSFPIRKNKSGCSFKFGDECINAEWIQGKRQSMHTLLFLHKDKGQTLRGLFVETGNANPENVAGVSK